MLMAQQCVGQRGQRPAQAEIALGNKGLMLREVSRCVVTSAKSSQRRRGLHGLQRARLIHGQLVVWLAVWLVEV